MLSRRDFATAQLSAIHQARRSLRDLDFEGNEWIDPFLAIERSDALLFFTPLKSLCGVYMPQVQGSDAAGILVSTIFPLSVQRFTAAHELGHLRMKHQPSLDTEADIIPRGASVRRDRGGNERQEVMAEAFAAHFLMPMRSVEKRMDSLGMARDDLRSADAVYELSLWFGASYSAMAWHLVSLKLLGRDRAEELLRTKPKQIKEALAGRDALVDWHNDVWPLTADRSGEVVHARVGDALAIVLPSHVSGGYLWDTSALDRDALEVLRVEPVSQDRLAIVRPGQSIPQQALVRVKRDGAFALALTERRPWAPEDRAAEFHVTVVAQGAFERGMSPRQRRARLELVRS